jgi:hypothetical protein
MAENEFCKDDERAQLIVDGAMEIDGLCPWTPTADRRPRADLLERPGFAR